MKVHVGPSYSNRCVGCRRCSSPSHNDEVMEFLKQWNFTNTCPLPVSEICLDMYAMRYVRCTCFCKKIWQCWSKIVLTICKNDEYCIFRFSIVICCYKNKCIVHISLRRYPRISPLKPEDKYSWRSIFMDSHLSPQAMVHGTADGRLHFHCSKTQSYWTKFSFLLKNTLVQIPFLGSQKIQKYTLATNGICTSVGIFQQKNTKIQ